MDKNSKSVKIVIADDHPVFRDAIKRLILGLSGIEIVGEAANGSEAVEFTRLNKPGILLLDIELPLLNGFDVARKLRAENPELKIIFLTMYNDEETFNSAIDIGVNGYVLKENTSTEILNCIEAVSAGKYYFSSLLSQYFVKRNSDAAELRQRTPTFGSLTISEKRILKLISQNKTSKEIAEILCISQKTVENHRLNIAKKLNVQGSHSLLKFALENKDKF